MNTFFSIIVPVYNVETWLERCINSILNQTYENFELILVDDGSPDNSGTICDKYVELDRRVSVIHKENGGLSSARNAGINMSKGDYIVFIDSDDYIKENLLENIEESIRKHHTDIIMFGYEMFLSKNKILPLFKKGLILNPKEEAVSLNKPNFKNEFCFTWRYVFKKEFLTYNDITFNENIKVAEDTIFNMECIFLAKSMYVIDEALYIYNDANNESIMRRRYKPNYHIDLNKQYLEKKRILKEYNINNNKFLDDYYYYYVYIIIQNCIKNICVGKKEYIYTDLKDLLNLEMCIDSFKYYNLKRLYKIADNKIFYLLLVMLKYRINIAVYAYCRYFYIKNK